MREVLEGFVSPEVASRILYEALVGAGSAPRSLPETLDFVRGPLTDVMARRADGGTRDEVLSQLESLIGRAIDNDGVAVDIDIDSGTFMAASTQVMTVVREPVSVVVLSSNEQLAERLVMVLGEDRVRTRLVSNDAALRKAAFSESALLVLVDAVHPASVELGALAAAIRGLPSSAVPVLWGSETPFARMIVPKLEAAGASLVTLERSEGIEPVLDLVLARYLGD